jgi:hypothetical protein
MARMRRVPESKITNTRRTDVPRERSARLAWIGNDQGQRTP